jgi:cytolysin-activating lysine-acyltransferase
MEDKQVMNDITKEKESQIEGQEKKESQVKIPNFILVESAIGIALMLATKSKNHQFLFASDFEWLILPAISLKQYKVFRSKKSEPIAFVTWAKVSEDVEKRLLNGHIKLAPKDWKSGDKLVLIDVIAPFGGSKEILKQLHDSEFKETTAHFLQRDADGKALVLKKLEDVLAEKTQKDS